VERAEAILDFLSNRRNVDGFIVPLRNVDLMREMTGLTSHGVAFGQAISLLEIASLNLDLPLIGRLIDFDRPGDCDGQWACWKPYMPFISLAPRFKSWWDEDFLRLKQELHSHRGRPSDIWTEMAKDSPWLLYRARAVAETTLQRYADLHMASGGVCSPRQPDGGVP
jgi:hypothetical protein